VGCRNPEFSSELIPWNTPARRSKDSGTYTSRE
jgi:hypothetical protein